MVLFIYRVGSKAVGWCSAESHQKQTTKSICELFTVMAADKTAVFL